jgi:tRNA (mo5U34)-methyltransferase
VTSFPDDHDGLAERVTARQWYHTIQLAPGVESPGWFDPSKALPRLPMPAQLKGLRCLDVGTFDGFWAFEMERRGAAEVIAIDILDESRWDWPFSTSADSLEAIRTRKAGGDGFLMAKAALGSRVERRDCSVYEVATDTVGMFDFIYLGSLLLHLRDPVLALERLRSVAKNRILCVDAFDVGLSVRHPWRAVSTLDGQGRPYWWKPNLASFRRMVEVAGFTIVEGPSPFLMPVGRGFPSVPLRPRNLRDHEARWMMFASHFGDPHASILATVTAKSEV